MSRAWMPIYWGDYFRDTGHLTTLQHGAYLLMIAHCWQRERLPEGDEARAAVARLPFKEWLKIKAIIEPLFLPDGTHKRVRQEIVTTEQKIMQRAIAGRKGGETSGRRRTLAALERQMMREANEAKRKQTRSEPEAIPKENPTTPCLDETKQPATIHKVSNINLSAERREPPLVGDEKEKYAPSPRLIASVQAKIRNS